MQDVIRRAAGLKWKQFGAKGQSGTKREKVWVNERGLHSKQDMVA